VIKVSTADGSLSALPISNSMSFNPDQSNKAWVPFRYGLEKMKVDPQYLDTHPFKAVLGNLLADGSRLHAELIFLFYG
jgi:hypothetical protein